MLWCHHHGGEGEGLARFWNHAVLCCHQDDGWWDKGGFLSALFYPYISFTCALCAFQEWAMYAVCGTGSDRWFVWQECRHLGLGRWWSGCPNTKRMVNLPVTNPCRPKENRCWWSTRHEHLSVYPLWFLYVPELTDTLRVVPLFLNRIGLRWNNSITSLWRIKSCLIHPQPPPHMNKQTEGATWTDRPAAKLDGSLKATGSN
jgi:hypothetical protein